MKKRIVSKQKIILKNKSLILVAGYPGTGKTTLARKLTHKVQVVYIDKDGINDVFSTSRMNSAYKESRVYVHKIMHAVASMNLELGNSVVLDAPFTKEYMDNKEWLQFIENFAKEHNATIKVIWCEALPCIRKKRILKRAYERDTEKIPQLDEFVSNAERMGIPFHHIYVETKKIEWGKVLDFLE